MILAIGTELTTGETRDTNGGDIAAALSRLGVQVLRIVQLPDDLPSVASAFREALEEADLTVSSGGLGPTPDDLTREGLAEALGQTPTVDPELERALVALFERRGLHMPETNRKQAWLIPSAVPLRNDHGTAPGWWVERGDRIVVTLPGPPRELRPMWADSVMPRLIARGLGFPLAVRTLRLTGIGESHVVEALGEAMLRANNPVVATYARPDAVDIRISARPESTPGRGSIRSAAEILAATEHAIEALLGQYIFAHDDETWPEALDHQLAGGRVATWEEGTRGALAALLAEAPWLARAEVLGDPRPAETAPSVNRSPEQLRDLSRSLREQAAVPVGLALAAVPQGADLQARVAVDIDGRSRYVQSTVFLDDAQGRRRAALAACAALWTALKAESRNPS